MNDQLLSIKKRIEDELKSAADLIELDRVETKFMGRKGEFTEALRLLADLPIEARKEAGALANSLKNEIRAKIKERSGELEKKAEPPASFDPTLPAAAPRKGSFHPVTRISEELEDLFMSMGFMVLEGPELESDFYNFEALNIPPHHPARDMQDTFYIDKKNSKGEFNLVMRTHTSPMQVRAMRKYGAPLRAVVPGKCFRNEATDVRHEHTFYQFEGLMIEKKISWSNMAAILEKMAKALYGEKTRVRFRPKFYPFVEPGANGEVSCFICDGAGCRLCKHTGWLEIFGCGLIHPNVLKAGGIDPAEFQGFAFGLGLTRIAMLKYGIDDVRLFNSGDMRFLEQF